MIVLDTSAVIAILASEPLAYALTNRIILETDRVMSVASYLEAGAVMAARKPRAPRRAIDIIEMFLEETGVRLHPVDEAQIRIALEARIRYGRGMGHGGVLNFGDTFSYALAKSLDVPLLYVGRDFSTTDIKSALD